MDYAMPFDDDAGVRWLLQGSKQVERRGRRGPWRATTVSCAFLTRQTTVDPHTEEPT
jgi:hypothetical protein